MSSVLLALVALQAVPPPVEQIAADCGYPVFATDMLVCSDPVLRALDTRLRSPPAVPATPFLVESRAAWFKRNRRCAFETAHRECALVAYDEAIETAAALSSSPAAAGRCRLRSGEQVEFATSGPDGVLMRDKRVIAYAKKANRSWRPFLTLQRIGAKVPLRNLDGVAVATCPATA